MGCTPIETARIFGPHPAVEAQLAAAQLDKAARFHLALQRGGQLMRQVPTHEPAANGDADDAAA